MATANVTQVNVRWYADDNADPDSCTPLAAQNATLDRQTGTAQRVIGRVLIQNDNSANWNQQTQWQYQNVTQSTGWQTLNAASSHVRTTNGTPADGAACDTSIITGGTGTFETDGSYNESTGQPTQAALAKNNYQEYAICLYVVAADVAHNDQIQVRLSASELGTWTNVLTLTVDAAQAIVLDGAVTVDSTIAATLAYNQNSAIAGDVTVGSTIASTMTYATSANDYTIAGAVTVTVTPDAQYAPDILNERFENPSGYDETWSENTSGASTLYTEKLVSNLAGSPPATWDTYCLELYKASSEDCFIRKNFASDAAISYVRVEFMIATGNGPSIGSGASFVRTFDASFNQLMGFGIYNSSGTPNLVSNIRYDGSNHFSYPTFSFDTFYVLEMLWDSTNDIYEMRLNGSTVGSGSLTGSAAGWSLRNLDLGDYAAEVGTVAVYFDNILVDSSRYPIFAGLEYNQHPSITGSVTVTVDPTATGNTTPDTFNETFEGTGTSETWSHSITLTGTSTYDEDQATSGVVSPPADWGDQCLYVDLVAGDDAYRRHTFSSDIPVAYGRVEVQVAAESLADGEYTLLYVAQDVSSNDLISVDIGQQASQLLFAFNVRHNGSSNFYGFNPVSLDTTYVIEWYWDTNADLWAIQVDGTLVAQGGLTGVAASRTFRQHFVGTFNYAADNNVSYFIDNVAVNTTGWPDTGGTGLDYKRRAALTGDVTVGSTIASGMTYSAGTADYTITGDVTVGLKVGEVGDIWDERLEGGGLEEAWTVRQTSGDGWFDPDYPVSSIAGAPASWGTFALDAGYATSGYGRAYKTWTTWTAGDVMYLRTAFILDSMTGSDGAWAGLLDVYGTDAFVEMFNIDLYVDSGYTSGQRCDVAIYHDDTRNAYAFEVEVDTPYVVDIMWDRANDLWAWRLNGTIQNSGSLTGTAATLMPWRMYWGETGGAVSSIRIYSDGLQIASTDYVGENPVAKYNRNADLTGAVTVGVDPTATVLSYNRNAAITGAVTVDSTVAATMTYSSGGVEHTITGDVTVGVDPTASDLTYNLNADIDGDVVVDSAVAAILAFNQHHELAGDVTVGVDPTASDLSYNRNASIDGSVTVDSAIAASTEYARHFLLAASVVLSLVPSSTMLEGRELTGDVTVGVDVASALSYAGENLINGDVTVGVSVASDMIEGRGINGSVTITPAIAADLDYTRNADLTGDVTVGVSVDAALEYSRHHDLAGDITVGVVPAATMLEGRILAGDVTVSVLVDSATAYSALDEIIGDVTVTVDPTATLAYNRHVQLAGDVTVGLTIDSAMAYSSEKAIVGAVTVGVDPTASALAYNQHPALTGDVTVSSTVAAVMAYASGNQIAGDVTVGVDVASGMLRNVNPSLTGDVTVGATPASALVRNIHPELTGAIAVGLDVSSAMVFGNVHQLTGDVTVGVDPTATSLLLNRHWLLTSDVTVTFAVAAGFTHEIHPELTGAVLVGFDIEGQPIYRQKLVVTIAPGTRVAVLMGPTRVRSLVGPTEARIALDSTS